MYRRLIVLSLIILAALCVVSWLGYRTIEMRAQGLEGMRIGQFAEVAEQIRQDVNRKLDEFIQREHRRPWTDYQYYYVPESAVATQQQMPLLRSPLGSQLEDSLAYGNFQIEPDGTVVTPYQRERQLEVGHQDELARKIDIHLDNIKQNVLPALDTASGTLRLPSAGLAVAPEAEVRSLSSAEADAYKLGVQTEQHSRVKGGRWEKYPIEGLRRDSQKEQIITQPRSIVASNVAQTVEPVEQQAVNMDISQATEHENAIQLNQAGRTARGPENDRGQVQQADSAVQEGAFQTQASRTQGAQQTQTGWQSPGDEEQAETVQIRIEPFVPLVIPDGSDQQSIFGQQVFLLRHVQIEEKHLLQGFQLNEKKLVEEVKESAERFMREGMTFELAQQTRLVRRVPKGTDEKVAYTAILDFGFGDLALNLKEIDPAWIAKEVYRLRSWYYSIIAIVSLAVLLGLASLWHNVRAQIALARKKDEFISAVSHELRTPLTSIRMYSEMLEKNWVVSKEKLVEYYKNMRQESERLSRLIENVLDFSRIQKGRKKYMFRLGDINKCVGEVAEMMTPYAAENGFCVKTELGQISQTLFDADSVTQIVVNLLDNAIKYARSAEDKTITVRTRREEQFVVIEVEDHGPGVPHRQRKKIFEEFYRIGAEATRETTGTGLGLALVEKFAQAHNGFVEISGAETTGVIFRVGLAVTY